MTITLLEVVSTLAFFTPSQFELIRFLLVYLGLGYTDVEFHMRGIKYSYLSRFELKNVTFDLEVAIYMRRIEFVSAGNTA